MRYFDAHTHAHFSAFKDDYREVIRRALDVGVGMVNVGTQKDTSRRAVEVAHEFEHEPIYAAVGLHPAHTSQSYHDESELGPASAEATAGEGWLKGFTSRGEEFDLDYYKKLAENPKVIAIGECGLDYYRMERIEDGGWRKEDGEKVQRQKEAFIAQIELAKTVGKPLMIHSRDAFRDTLEMLKAADARGGIAHSFVRTIDEARELLDLGFYFTFAGNITFKPRPDKPSADEVIRFIPADRILSETDAPYLAPVPYRGKRNEPLYVIEVTKKLAEIKGLTIEAMAERILENAKRVFGIP
jgi:TatD DNase family protein